MKRTEQLPEEVVSVPNLVADEDGAVMVEFLIVLPFLMTVVIGMLFYMDVNRFLTATQQMAGVQAWEAVARNASADAGDSEFEKDDEYGLGGVPIPGGIGAIAGSANVRNAMIASSVAGGDFRAGAIYSVGGLSNPVAPPYVIQNMTNGTFDTRELDMNNLGGPNDIIYRNETYTTPLMGVLHSYVGSSTQQGTTIDRREIAIGARQSAMNDPHSVYYGEGEQRLRNVDRFTIIRDPIYLGAAITQTFISGNVVIFADFGEITTDLGYDLGPISGVLGFISNSAIGDILGGVGALLEQAEPLRKVDKRMDKDHDTDGEADWGMEEIPDERKLEEVSSQSDRKDMAY